MLLQSTLAPLSKRNVKPLTVGRHVPRAGLSMPLILPIIKVPPVKTAPVLPAETKAEASLFLTKLSPTTIDESFFRLMAFVGDSSVEITSVAFLIVILD